MQWEVKTTTTKTPWLLQDAGSGANQREFTISKVDTIYSPLAQYSGKCGNICAVWLWGPQERKDHHFSQVDT